MRETFPSIAYPDKYGYEFDTDAWTTGAVLKMEYRMFGTYGDGLTQHTGAYAITHLYAADYLFSLAAAILENPDLTRRHYDLDAAPSAEAITFAASIVYKKTDQWEKPRWFSVGLQKIGTTPKLEHDKRYTRIESWHDGSARAVVNLLTPEHVNGLRQFVIADAVREWGHEKGNRFATGWNIDAVSDFLNWPAQPEIDHFHYSAELRQAIRAARAAIQAHELRESVKSNLSNYTNNNGHMRNARKAAALQLVAEN